MLIRFSTILTLFLLDKSVSYGFRDEDVTAATTNETPNVSACKKQATLSTANESFIRKLCWPNISALNASQASEVCQSYKMQLFTIDSSETYEAYRTYLLKSFREVKVLINARLQLSGEVFTITKPVVPIFRNYTYSGGTSNGCIGIIKTVRNVIRVQAAGCNGNTGSFHCEFGAPAPYLTPPTTTPEPTEPEEPEETDDPNSDDGSDLSACAHKKKLKTPDGTFIKSVCWINTTNLNSSQASDMCQSYKMQLFTAESSEAYDAYIKYILSKFPKSLWIKFLINARLKKNGDVVTVTMPELPIYDIKIVGKGNNGCVGIVKNTKNEIKILIEGCLKVQGSFHCQYGAPAPYLTPPTTTTTEGAIPEENPEEGPEEGPEGNEESLPAVDPNSKACGTFVGYDYLKDPNAPAINGFKVAKNSTANVFVGFGTGSCMEFSKMVAHVFIPPENPVAMTVCDKVVIDADSPKYLLNHTKLSWIDVTKFNSKTSGSLVKFQDSASKAFLNFGRILVNTRFGSIYKVGNYRSNTLFYRTGSYNQMSRSQLVSTTNSFQVLVCKP